MKNSLSYVSYMEWLYVTIEQIFLKDRFPTPDQPCRPLHSFDFSRMNVERKMEPPYMYAVMLEFGFQKRVQIDTLEFLDIGDACLVDKFGHQLGRLSPRILDSSINFFSTSSTSIIRVLKHRRDHSWHVYRPFQGRWEKEGGVREWWEGHTVWTVIDRNCVQKMTKHSKKDRKIEFVILDPA